MDIFASFMPLLQVFTAVMTEATAQSFNKIIHQERASSKLWDPFYDKFLAFLAPPASLDEVKVSLVTFGVQAPEISWRNHASPFLVVNNSVKKSL